MGERKILLGVEGDDGGDGIHVQIILKINCWCVLASSGSIWQYLALHPQGAKLPLTTCAQG